MHHHVNLRMLDDSFTFKSVVEANADQCLFHEKNVYTDSVDGVLQYLHLQSSQIL